MGSLPRALIAGPKSAITNVGHALQHPLAPVHSVRELWTTPDDEPDVFEEMTLLEHLEELRSRLVKTCLALVPAFILGLLLSAPMLRLIAHQANVQHGFLIISPTEPFTVYMKVALYIAIAIGFPLIFYQVLAFIAPGLTRKEKRYLLTALPIVTLLFLLGAAFAFFIAAPKAFGFLSSFNSDVFRWQPQGEEVISFYLTLMIGMGVAFELPVLMWVLARLRIANYNRQRHFWRFAIVIILVAAAIITPTPDPFNMMIVASPLVLLYGLGLLLARQATRAATNHAATV